MYYQFQNTTKNEDAILFAKAKLERIDQYPEFAKNVHDNSCAYSNELACLKRDGLCVVRNLIPRDFILFLSNKIEEKVFENIDTLKVRNHASESKDTDKMQIMYTSLKGHKDLTTARKVSAGIHLKDPLVHIPEFCTFLLEPTIQGIVTGYYESIPKLTFAKAMINFNNSLGPRDTQLWHSDPGSFRILKLFVYLDDVDEDSGAFQIIKGSHYNKFDGWDQETRHPHDKMLKHYSRKDFETVTAKAGDVFFADATAFHRGSVPITKDRKILILNFCIQREYGLPYTTTKILKKTVDNFSGLAAAFLDGLEVIGEKDET